MAFRLTSQGFAKNIAAAAAIGLSVWLLAPAQAQFLDLGRPLRELFGVPRGWDRGDREGSSDFLHAPAPAAKKPEATTSIVVMGDANADWLAYGLEDAFAEKPEIAIVRKQRADSGLIRYDQRRESDWPQVTREIIAAEKPNYIVMMIGNNDHQSIREKMPPVVRPGAASPAGTRNAASRQQGVQPAVATPPAPKAEDLDPEAQPPDHPAPAANLTPEQARTASYGPWEFHTEKWEIAYIKRIDATVSALKSAGVPVFWVGLPSQRSTKASADSSYLNEIYRSRAEKAGITYVDIWDGFVDEGGRFSPQGPDYEGQIRRLRSGDGVYFTRFGARKLAHYVEREIQRHMINHAVPAALPMPEMGSPVPNAKPGAPTQRPSVGPVVPLTAFNVRSDELLGGSSQGNRPPATDPLVSRVLAKGEPISAPGGRADDFSWPRTSGVNIDTSPLEKTPAAISVSAPAPEKQVAAPRQGAQTAGASAPVQRRPRSGDQFPLPFFFQNLFR